MRATSLAALLLAALIQAGACQEPAPRRTPPAPGVAPVRTVSVWAVAHVEEGDVEVGLAPGDDVVEGDRLVVTRAGEAVALLVVERTWVDREEGDGCTAEVVATTRDLWPRPGDRVAPERKEAPFRAARVTLAARDLDVTAALAQIAAQAGKDVDVDEEVPLRRVTVDLRDVPWDEAVLEVARLAGLKALVDPAGALVTRE